MLADLVHLLLTGAGLLLTLRTGRVFAGLLHPLFLGHCRVAVPGLLLALGAAGIAVLFLRFRRGRCVGFVAVGHLRPFPVFHKVAKSFVVVGFQRLHAGVMDIVGHVCRAFAVPAVVVGKCRGCRHCERRCGTKCNQSRFHGLLLFE